MDLGIKKVIDSGNGNTLLFTGLLFAAGANLIPTPMDSFYFRRVNKLERDFDDGKISAEKLEYNVAAGYYIYTTFWYLILFTGIYAIGGEYKNNARILLALAAGGLVLGAVQKNIEIDKSIQEKKAKAIQSTTTTTA